MEGSLLPAFGARSIALSTAGEPTTPTPLRLPWPAYRCLGAGVRAVVRPSRRCGGRRDGLLAAGDRAAVPVADRTVRRTAGALAAARADDRHPRRRDLLRARPRLVEPRDSPDQAGQCD